MRPPMEQASSAGAGGPSAWDAGRWLAARGDQRQQTCLACTTDAASRAGYYLLGSALGTAVVGLQRSGWQLPLNSLLLGALGSQQRAAMRCAGGASWNSFHSPLPIMGRAVTETPPTGPPSRAASNAWHGLGIPGQGGMARHSPLPCLGRLPLGRGRSATNTANLQLQTSGMCCAGQGMVGARLPGAGHLLPHRSGWGCGTGTSGPGRSAAAAARESAAAPAAAMVTTHNPRKHLHPARLGKPLLTTPIPPPCAPPSQPAPPAGCACCRAPRQPGQQTPRSEAARRRRPAAG